MNPQPIRELAQRYRLILGSASPRRSELLRELSIPFEQKPAAIAETRRTDESPEAYAGRLSREKAEAVWRAVNDSRAVIIGCDTVVSMGAEIFEKPESAEHAVAILRALSGREHTVTTAVTLLGEAGRESGADQTSVRFREYDEAAARTYVETGEPMDKAGAYGIQGMGGFLVDSIRGNLDTVIGLPRVLLVRLTERFLQLR